MATKVNLIIDQGATFRTTITLTDEVDGSPLDLTTYTAVGQIRKHYSSANFVPFTITLSNTGIVELNLSANASSSMEAGRYVYDVELTAANGAITRIVEGIVNLTPEVTR